MKPRLHAAGICDCCDAPEEEDMTDGPVLLRQYADSECGPDGYPYAWHTSTEVWSGENDLSVWPAIKDLIREQAGHRCIRCGHPYRKGEHGNGEWSPCDERCTHGGPTGIIRDAILVDPGEPIPEELRGRPGVVHARWRILTVHHLDSDKANCRWWNLAALCQRCHLRMQRTVVMGRPYHYEHSEWFKPFAAGFYAWKYLGEDLTRGEVEIRMPSLLTLEHRFTQEVLLDD